MVVTTQEGGACQGRGTSFSGRRGRSTLDGKGREGGARARRPGQSAALFTGAAPGPGPLPEMIRQHSSSKMPRAQFGPPPPYRRPVESRTGGSQTRKAPTFRPVWRPSPRASADLNGGAQERSGTPSLQVCRAALVEHPTKAARCSGSSCLPPRTCPNGTTGGVLGGNAEARERRSIKGVTTDFNRRVGRPEGLRI